jgi:ankyrin repeat protein
MEKSSDVEHFVASRDSKLLDLPPTYEAPNTLEEACIIGCLDQIQELFTTMSETWGRNPAFQKCAQQTVDTSIYNAASHNHPAAISYFLDNGIPITDALVATACEFGATEVFQVLLDHGWDINSRNWLGVPSLM